MLQALNPFHEVPIMKTHNNKRKSPKVFIYYRHYTAMIIIILHCAARLRRRPGFIIISTMVFSQVLISKLISPRLPSARHSESSPIFTPFDRDRFFLAPFPTRLCRTVDSSFFFHPLSDGFNDSGWLMRVIHHLKECHQLPRIHLAAVVPSSPPPNPTPPVRRLTSHANI